MLYLTIKWDIKFRAFGITFGHYSDNKVIPVTLSFEAQVLESIIAQLLHLKNAYAYNDHGVVISVGLSDTKQ